METGDGKSDPPPDISVGSSKEPTEDGVKNGVVSHVVKDDAGNHGKSSEEIQHSAMIPEGESNSDDQHMSSDDESESNNPDMPFALQEASDGYHTPRSGADTPRHSNNVMLTPQRSPLSQHEIDPDEIDAGDCDRNPEAPSELTDDLITADTIGGTVFSKHWLFSTLMKLIQAVDQHTESKEVPQDAVGDGAADGGLDLEDSLQDELCKLWDMSMNADIVTFLQEFKAIEILTGVIAKSKAPRATEICVGILGNMACTESAVQEISANVKLVSLVVMLLADSDAPTLVEVTRLLHTCVSSVMSEVWKTAIKEEPSVYEQSKFILSSSTNSDLLHNTAELVDKVMDLDESLCEMWSTNEMAQAVLEAARQSGTESASETLDSLFHILQLMSTVESGVVVLVSQAEAILSVLLDYLTKMCADEIVGVEGKENSFASSFSILSVILCGWDKSSNHLEQDFQAVRCLLKVLEVVYPKRHKVKLRRRHRQRGRRRRTTSEGTRSPTARRRDSHRDAARVPLLDPNVSMNVTLDERLLNTTMKSEEEEKEEAPSQSAVGDDKPGDGGESDLKSANSTMETGEQNASETEPTKPNEDVHVNTESGDKSERTAAENHDGSSDQTVEQVSGPPDGPEDAGGEKTDSKSIANHDASSSDESELSSSSSSSSSSSDHSDDDDGDSKATTKMLEEVLQQFGVDVVQTLSKSSVPDEDADQWFVPKTLKYLDSMCSRDRLYMLVWTLDNVTAQPDVSYVKLLQNLAQQFDQLRLARIIDDALDT